LRIVTLEEKRTVKVTVFARTSMLEAVVVARARERFWRQI
jgi:hypothetical protein